MDGEVIQLLYTTLVLGSTYAVMATGFTLVFGALRFMNLAYGGLFMIGAFAAYAAVSVGVPAFAGLVVAFAAGGLASALMHLGVFQWLLKRPDRESSTVAAGLGFALIIQAVIVLMFGARPRAYPELVTGLIQLPGEVPATAQAGLIVASAFIVIILLSLFLGRTRYGIAIRALGFSSMGAELIGISTARLTLLTMVLSGGLAGLSGILLSGFYFVSVTTGFTVLMKALIVTIVGGLGNVRGALMAAFALAFTETLVSTVIGSDWVLPIVFAATLTLLALRPQGLAGRVSFETEG